MGREDYEIFRVRKKEKQDTGEQRRQEATAAFTEDFQFARVHDIELKRCSDTHYQAIVRHADNTPRWLYNLYPGNQRVYSDETYHGPFIPVQKPWTIRTFVEALIAYRKRESRGRGSLRRKYG